MAPRMHTCLVFTFSLNRRFAKSSSWFKSMSQPDESISVGGNFERVLKFNGDASLRESFSGIYTLLNVSISFASSA